MEQEQRGEIVKLSVNLPREVAEDLRAMAEARSTTVTEVLRRSVHTQKYLWQQIAEGGTVLIRKQDGTLVEVQFHY